MPERRGMYLIACDPSVSEPSWPTFAPPSVSGSLVDKSGPNMGMLSSKPARPPASATRTPCSAALNR